MTAFATRAILLAWARKANWASWQPHLPPPAISSNQVPQTFAFNHLITPATALPW